LWRPSRTTASLHRVLSSGLSAPNVTRPNGQQGRPTPYILLLLVFQDLMHSNPSVEYFFEELLIDYNERQANHSRLDFPTLHTRHECLEKVIVGRVRRLVGPSKQDMSKCSLRSHISMIVLVPLQYTLSIVIQIDSVKNTGLVRPNSRFPQLHLDTRRHHFPSPLFPMLVVRRAVPLLPVIGCFHPNLGLSLHFLLRFIWNSARLLRLWDKRHQ
jgi:hypothetical protein